MNILQTFVYDFRALPVKVVYYPVYEFFITGYGRSRNNYRIVHPDSYRRIVTVCHTGERAHWLALTARGNYDDFLVAHIAYFGNVDYNVGRNSYFPDFFRRLYNV